MSGLEQLHQLLAAVTAAVADARAHTDQATRLLEQARQAMVDAQAQAQPWLPPQLPQALDQLESHTGKLAGVDGLLERYGARL
jgi:hypothetical protein